VKNQAGHFTVASIAGWGGPDYAVPLRYNLFHHESHKFVDHPAELVIPVEAEELPEATCMIAAAERNFEHQREQRWKQRQTRLSERMLAMPDRTRRMALHLLGRTTAETMEITELAERLVPKYRVTHCWKCRSSLNNLEYDLCPTCGGIRCSCGACLCGSPWFIMPR
jgi:hypothetical protein